MPRFPTILHGKYNAGINSKIFSKFFILKTLRIFHKQPCILKKEILSILEIFRLSYGNATAWSKMFAWAVNSRKVLFDVKKYINREL